jgi:hypothetical protein
MKQIVRRLALTIAAVVLTLMPGAPFTVSASAGPDCAATVFWDANFGGEARELHHSVAYVGDHWNDQISSIIVHRGHWIFFWDANFQGEELRLRPGRYEYVGDHWNDQISSARCLSE